ncbi:hypothetical protein JXJ21_06210 [candidate division KSB1 bacterium]|nr:hypothetical protein [candidate division KSB1 bacterium]
MQYRIHVALIGILILVLFSCDQNPFHPDKTPHPFDNNAPETYLFLFMVPDTSIVTDSVKSDTIITEFDTTASKQVLHWWGDDSDGHIAGYYIQWDYQTEPIWTTAEYDTFYVPIRTSFSRFTFRVWAVDNDSLIDPTPAILTFPVYNSKPFVEFKTNSNPEAPDGNPNVIAYTFPTRTFLWEASDPDGLETITQIYYALDDTSDWIDLAGDERSITLTEIPPGEHRFFLKAMDIAGAQSQVISFPDPEDNTTPNTWVVKEPIGDILLVDDYAQGQNTKATQDIYRGMLNNIVGENGYSLWEIGTSSTPVFNPQNSLPYATADIKAYLGYFKKVIWFAHLGLPNLSNAGLSLTQYIAGGGKVFITNGNLAEPDTAWTFTSIDSVHALNPGGRLFKGVGINAFFTNTAADTALDLELGKLLGNRVYQLVPGPDCEVVYRMQHDTTATVTVPYKGTPVVGIRYRVGAGESIYFSLPFHYCDGKFNMEAVLRYILFEEFK